MHNIIKQLEEDHYKILVFLENFENELITFMEKDLFSMERYTDAITFIREFADKIHHQREEEILFHYLITHGGKAAETLVRQGMLIEHDQARFYVKELERAVQRYALKKGAHDKLSILAFGKSYCELLRRHIDKENNTVYPFAERILSNDLFANMSEEDITFQNNVAK